MVDNKPRRGGQSLTGLIGTRRVEGPVPPIITVGRIPIEVLKAIRVMDAPINIEGVPLESSDVMAQKLSEAFAKAMGKAVNEHGREQNPA